MEQNTETPDHCLHLVSICAAMGKVGKTNAVDKFGKGSDNLEHTWEAYHFTGFIKETFEVDYPRLMNEFVVLLRTLSIDTYGEFRKLPSAQGFTEERAKALFKGVLKIRNESAVKTKQIKEHELLLEFLTFCQQPFTTKTGTTKSRVMSIFYGEESDSSTTIKQNDPALIERAQFKLSKEIEKLKKYPASSEDTTLESNEPYTHVVPHTFTKEQIAFIREAVKSLPDIIQKELLDQTKKQKIQITELKTLVSELQKRIDELLNSDNVTDEIKSLIEAGEIDEAEARVDQIVATTVKEQQQKHGEYFYQQGKVKELKLKYKEAYEAFKQAVNCQPNNTEYLNNAGLLGTNIADYEQAYQFFDKLLKLTTNEFGEDHLNTANSYNNLALNLDAQGKYEEAEPLFRKSLDIRLRIFGEDHPNTATGYNSLGYSLDALGKYEEAEPLFRKGLDIRLRVFGKDHPDTATSYNNLALNLNTQGKYEGAEPLFRKGLDIRLRVFGKDHLDTANSYNSLGYNLHTQGKYSKAEPFLRKSIDIYRKILGEDHLNTAASYNYLALHLNTQGKYDEAEPLYRKSYEILLRVLGEHHPTTKTILNNWQKNKP